MKKLLVLVALIGVVAFSVNSASAGIRAIGVNAGWVSPQDIDGTWTIGMSADIGMPMTNFYISPFVNYWTRSENFSDPFLGSSELSYSDVEFGGTAKLIIPTSATNVTPFVGAGIAAHTISADVSVGGLGSVSASDTKVGYHVGGGLEFGATPRMNIVGSGWYSMVQDFNQWSIRGGLSWNI